MRHDEQKPLLIVTAFNRKDETIQTLDALQKSVDLRELETVIVDNGSTDGTAEALVAYSDRHVDKEAFFELILMDHNIGCPRALNLALERYRQPGQAVIKLDNDVLILQPGWLERVRKIESVFNGRGEKAFGHLAMIGAWYEGFDRDGRGTGKHIYMDGYTLSEMHHIIGHAVYHTAAFMDAVGYFDVLADDHLYGFEDMIISSKAKQIDLRMFVSSAWAVQNIQRHSAIDAVEKRDTHVARLRPLYNARVQAISQGGTLYTDQHGQPAPGPAVTAR